MMLDTNLTEKAMRKAKADNGPREYVVTPVPGLGWIIDDMTHSSGCAVTVGYTLAAIYDG